MAPMAARECVVCGGQYQPRPGGWNARYCSPGCRLSRRNRKSRAGDVTHYSRIIKGDPERLAAHRARSRASRARVCAWLADYKLTRGCVDCGYRRHPAALQLDHTGPKTAEIGSIRTSITRLLREITDGACVVRCANCHAVKTWAQKKGLPDPNGHAEWTGHVNA